MDVILAGCGFIARTHISALTKLGHRVTWVVGRDLKRTEKFAEESGIPNATADIEEALDSGAACVHICTPPLEHAGIIRKSLAAGKHIICEKPLCISYEEAAELVEAARRARKEKGLITALCCNVRFYRANMKARDMIRSGELGKPMIISGSYLQEFHVPPHDDGWRFDPAQSGGQRAISEIGTHWIDLAYSWTGLRIDTVYADLGSWYPVRYRKDGKLTLDKSGEPVRVETEDAAAVSMRFENGAIGTLMLSEVSQGHGNDLTIETACSAGSLMWEELRPGRLLCSDSGQMTAEDFDDSEREDTFVRLFSEVYSAIEKREHGDYPTFSDGAYNAAVCEAIRRSGDTGARVKLSELLTAEL